MFKEYDISFYGKRYKEKPTGKEIGEISRKLTANRLSYDFIVKRVGENGCVFDPKVYNGTRKSDNFAAQQLFVIDIDENGTFVDMKMRAEKYNLPLLFAYRTASWKPDSDKFRLVFAMDKVITDADTAKIITAMFMRIFNECDKSCGDLARMFFGSTIGLYYLSDEPREISIQSLIIAFNSYMYDKYGESHYTREIAKFYNEGDKRFCVETNGKLPVFSYNENGSPVIKTTAKTTICNKIKVKEKRERRQTTKVDFTELEKQCKLYSDFVNGKEYYYYRELFHIATNLVNMDKGKAEFMRVLESDKNIDKESYHNRSWKPILNTIIDMGYKPQSCDKCPHCNDCLHYKNMILTVAPGYCRIKPIEKKEYCSLEEAEESLSENFQAALNSQQNVLKLIKAQTGLGKTNIYLNYLKYAEENFIIAVPTHNLAREIYAKALKIGVKNIRIVPELPVLSDSLTKFIKHIYSIGAGEIGLETLRNIYDNNQCEESDRMQLKAFFNSLDESVEYSGHIIMTHERFLCMNRNAELLKNHRVIIDEDILRSVYSAVIVDNNDIRNALNKNIFSTKTRERMNSILATEGYQRYDTSAGLSVNTDVIKSLVNINTNILDLLQAKVLMNDGETTTYIKQRRFPSNTAIIMSATANACIYKWLFNMNVEEYICKAAKYMGRIEQYTNSSYSRYALTAGKDSEQLMREIHNITDNNEIITFKCIEQEFYTEYHFGGIEGLNCLEGNDISVIGLPNVDEKVYRLYGMLMGIDYKESNLKNIKVQYNGFEFYINTFMDHRLQTIQMWILSSLLEQAVGRARLLRHNCTVKVFARFPIEQAVVI